MKPCKFFFIALITLIISMQAASALDAWWSPDWKYRLKFEVNTSTYNRADWPVEMEINFSSELSGMGISSAFDPNSARVIEYNSSGSIISEHPSQFEPAAYYNASTNALGNVIFTLNGTTGQNVVRYFYVYYGTIEAPKGAGAYSSRLAYKWNGEEFSLNNSLLDLIVDTKRDENTSGLYYAKRIDSGKEIFNTPSTERAVEYIQYYNGSTFGFNFTGNAMLAVNGSVKLVIEQIGNEVYWNTNSETGQGRITKRYTIYGNTSWIKIRQAFQNTGSGDIDRSANGINALALDANRAFGIDSLSTPTSDPMSWRSAYNTAGAKGVGVINYNETNTSNFAASGNIVTGKIGIQLSSTTISSGNGIIEEAIVYFNDQANHTLVEDIKNRLATPVTINRTASEAYNITINVSTGFNLYNLNESISVSANITQDIYNLS